MAESPYPSQQQDKFVLRLPDGMRERIKEAAAANNRSMNAEIVATLEEKYPPPKAGSMTVTEWLELVEAALRPPTTGTRAHLEPESRDALLRVRDLLAEAVKADPDAMFPQPPETPAE